MNRGKILFQSFVLILFCTFTCSSSAVFAEIKPDYGKVFPPKETFQPGDWFIGTIPAHVDRTKLPIVFVQGKNGRASDWYGNTYYHGKNNMYENAYYDGYQTVFLQLYDAAGEGSANPWENGRLLAEKLEEIYNYFGQKINIIAHSKGGIDTQAALVQYGAYRFVDKVITLGSPHYGTHLADLVYSWWAGWLASLLGQRDEGTYALQTGEMSRFRSIIDTNPAIKSNQYYTVAGTSWGPIFSALSVGGLYLSPYGNNDGLVSEWSTKLPYSLHLFSDARLDHDSVRMGTSVFSRIEPYLRNKKTLKELILPSSSSTREQYGEIDVTENQTVLGGELFSHIENSATFLVDTSTQGTVSILTANKNVAIKLISPSGKIYNKQDEVLMTGDNLFFKGAFIQKFQVKDMEIGEWKLDMQTGVKDAYLAIVQYKQESPFQLKVFDKVKTDQIELQIQSSDEKMIEVGELSMTVRVVNRAGALISKSDKIKQINANTLSTILQDIEQSGVYNFTIDVKGKNKVGNPYTRTIIRSMYIEK